MTITTAARAEGSVVVIIVWELLFCVGTSFAARRCSAEHYRLYSNHAGSQNAASSFLVFYRQFSKDNGSSFYGSGSDPRDPTNSSSGGGSGSHTGGGGGDKRDGWMCPNCGELCSHVDLFICKCFYVSDSMTTVV